MPPWVKQAMMIKFGEDLYLPCRFRPGRDRNVYLEWLAEQPQGTWIMGFHIDGNGKYRKDALTIAISMGAGTLKFVVAQRLPAAITSVEAFERDMIANGVPVREGGFGNPSLHAQHQHALLMYTPVIDEQDEANIASQLAQLNMAGHLSHLK